MTRFDSKHFLLEQLEDGDVEAIRDLVRAGHRVLVHVAPDPDETEGVNTRVELAGAAATLRDATVRRDAAMERKGRMRATAKGTRRRGRQFRKCVGENVGGENIR